MANAISLLSSDQPSLQGGGFGDPSSEVYNRLLRDRIVFLGTEVNDHIANLITAQLLYLEGEDPDKDIWLYINSPGGSVTAGMAIYDTMQFVAARRGHHLHGPRRVDGPVPAVRRRHRASAIALPHARIMMHQPSGGFQGQAADIAIQAEQMVYIKRLHGRAHRRTTPARPSSRSKPTPSATAGSPPSRPRTTASSTR